jgi:NitT/TauT family transport system substrate-binding protein
LDGKKLRNEGARSYESGSDECLFNFFAADVKNRGELMRNRKTRIEPCVKDIHGGILALLLIPAIALICMGSWSCQKQQYSGPIEKLTLGTGPQVLSTFIWVAESQGYFAQNGLEVTINQYETGAYAVDNLISGVNDIACATEYVLAVNSFVASNVRAFAQLGTANNHEIVVEKGHGIEKPSDLKGKKIGLTSKTTSEFFLGRFLLFNNLTLSDVEVIDLKPSQLVESLVNNKIDAASLFEPNIYDIKQQIGSEVIGWPSQMGRDGYWLLISREDVLKNHPAAIERFLKAMLRSEEFINKNSEKAMQIAAQKFKLEDAYIKYAWPKSYFKISLDEGLLLSMEDQAKWLISNRLTNKTQIPNYLDFVQMDVLKKTNPKGIRIIN